MRHRKAGRQLNRNSSHRKAMYRNMACSLFEHQVIRTTLPKAKELRRVVEPLITHAKNNDSVAGRRLAFDRLRSDDAVAALFNDIAPRCKDRQGGYVRILKCGFRTGDKAPMAYVEIVDREGALNNEAPNDTAPTTSAIDESTSEANDNNAVEATVDTATDAQQFAAQAGDEDSVEAVLGDDFDEAAAKDALGKKIKLNDLTMIEGIGPKIAEIFTNAGIDTWAKLAENTPEQLKAILVEAGDRYKMHDPNTWPRQADLAAKGEWKALADWQDQLDGGKEVS